MASPGELRLVLEQRLQEVVVFGILIPVLLWRSLSVATTDDEEEAEERPRPSFASSASARSSCLPFSRGGLEPVQHHAELIGIYALAVPGWSC